MTSDAYKAELAEVKNASSNLTSAQKAAIEYWGGNAIARWDQIAQAMAAKYNLPPAEDADGTYHLPNSKDPVLIHISHLLILHMQVVLLHIGVQQNLML